MVEQGTTVVEQPKTEQQLMQEMQAAVKSGDYKSVAKVAGELVKFQKAKEQLELEAKQKVLETKTLAVKAAITKALDRLISSGELDQADGIWYANDFGEKLVSCRLSKVAAKAKSGGGGGGIRRNRLDGRRRGHGEDARRRLRGRNRLGYPGGNESGNHRRPRRDGILRRTASRHRGGRLSPLHPAHCRHARERHTR